MRVEIREPVPYLYLRLKSKNGNSLFIFLDPAILKSLFIFMKLKTTFICEQCGYSSPKWIGKCPECDHWNSFYEEIMAPKFSGNLKNIAGKDRVIKPVALIRARSEKERISTQMHELDRVLGGGIMEGSLILLSGEPGIGKSTLTLQICDSVAAFKKKVFYVSGEESAEQVAQRAQRMGITRENIDIFTENLLENILAVLDMENPGLVIIDSIQVISSANLPSLAGSINQVRFCTESLMNFAKKNNVPVLIVGHVTKEGSLAGPKILEHLVDTVLLIEGERYQNFRLVRGLKNRYGSTNEIGLFEMTEHGLQQVDNASKLFLEGRKTNSFGSAITATLEGTRPLLMEVQALTHVTAFGYPKRAASGFDLNRLQLLIAVIQKHLRLNLSNQDVYVNIVGGFRLSDPAADLAVAMAIISSFQKEPLSADTVYIGEIGLAGELRPASQLQKRLQEAEKIGFIHAVLPPSPEKLKLTTLKVQHVEYLQKLLLK